MFRRRWQLAILVVLVITSPLVSKWVLERSREFQSVEWTPLFENSVTYALASPGTQYAQLSPTTNYTCGSTCPITVCGTTCGSTCGSTCPVTVCGTTCGSTCGSTCPITVCGTTCGSTCGSTCPITVCGATCDYTCGGTCSPTCEATCDYTCDGPTCFSTCDITCGATVCGSTCDITCNPTCGPTCGGITCGGTCTEATVCVPTCVGEPGCEDMIPIPPSPNLGTEDVYSDDFEDSSSGWLTERGVNAEYSYRSGEYVIEVKRANWVAWAWAPTDLVPTDFEAVVEARALSNVPGSYGIVWGDNDDFYLFEVTTEGRCGIYRSRGGQWQTIVSSRWNGAIRSRGTNLLLISVSGGTVKFRINGETAVTRSLARPSSNQVGLLAGTYSQTPFAAAFDDFEIR